MRAYAVVETLAAASGALLVAAFPYLPALFRPLFAAMTPRAQAVTVFHHCLLGPQGRQLVGWMRQPDAALSAWAERACPPAG